MSVLRWASAGAAGAAAVALFAAVPPGDALAHGAADRVPALPESLWSSWSLSAEVVLPLLLVGWLYGRGLARLWGRAGFWRGVTFRQVTCFVLGWLALAVALVSPLDAMAGALASAHMVQHMILLVVAPPLLLLGNSTLPLLWALPEGRRAPVGRFFGHAAGPQFLWRGLSAPMVAGALFAAAIWLWHVPALYEAALASRIVHALEHATLLAAGLLYWHRLMAPLRESEAGYGGAVLSVLATMMHTGLLGALMTFARTPWYPAYAPWPELWGLTLLEDQQLAGLIMWVPMGFVYLGAALWLMAHWLRLAGQQRPRPVTVAADGERR